MGFIAAEKLVSIGYTRVTHLGGAMIPPGKVRKAIAVSSTAT